MYIMYAYAYMYIHIHRYDDQRHEHVVAGAVAGPDSCPERVRPQALKTLKKEAPDQVDVPHLIHRQPRLHLVAAGEDAFRGRQRSI